MTRLPRRFGSASTVERELGAKGKRKPVLPLAIWEFMFVSRKIVGGFRGQEKVHAGVAGREGRVRDFPLRCVTILPN